MIYIDIQKNNINCNNIPNKLPSIQYAVTNSRLLVPSLTHDGAQGRNNSAILNRTRPSIRPWPAKRYTAPPPYTNHRTRKRENSDETQSNELEQHTMTIQEADDEHDNDIDNEDK